MFLDTTELGGTYEVDVYVDVLTDYDMVQVGVGVTNVRDRNIATTDSNSFVMGQSTVGGIAMYIGAVIDRLTGQQMKG
jgi:hypothetical protein